MNRLAALLTAAHATAAVLSLTAPVARADDKPSTPPAQTAPAQSTPAQPAPAAGGQGGAPAAQPAAAAGPRDVSNYNLPKAEAGGAPVGLKGYDPVSYFPEGGGKPSKGDEKITLEHRGVTYRFATAKHRDLFKADPDKYEPAYGGWCASAIADGGRKVDIDPKAYKLTGGRLFLFYTDLFTDARSYWNKDEGGNTRKADEQWKTIAGEAPRTPGQKPAAGDAKPSGDAPAPAGQPPKKG